MKTETAKEIQKKLNSVGRVDSLIEKLDLYPPSTHSVEMKIKFFNKSTQTSNDSMEMWFYSKNEQDEIVGLDINELLKLIRIKLIESRKEVTEYIEKI